MGVPPEVLVATEVLRVAAPTPGEARCIAVSVNRSRSWVAVRLGSILQTREAMPAITGLAAEVPLKVVLTDMNLCWTRVEAGVPPIKPAALNTKFREVSS